MNFVNGTYAIHVFHDSVHMELVSLISIKVFGTVIDSSDLDSK